LVSWKTRKQKTIAKSSVKVVYGSMSAITCELEWLSHLMEDFFLDPQLRIPLYYDNKAAMHIAANSIFQELDICLLTAITPGISSWKVFFLPPMSLPKDNLLIL